MMQAGAGQRIQIHLQKEYLPEKEKMLGHFSEERSPGFLPYYQRAGSLRQGAHLGFMVHRGKPRKSGTTPQSNSLGDKEVCSSELSRDAKNIPTSILRGGGASEMHDTVFNENLPALRHIKNLPDLRDIKRTPMRVAMYVSHSSKSWHSFIYDSASLGQRLLLSA